MVISYCTEKSLIFFTRCCKLCLYVDMYVCVCVLHIGMRGRKKICYILRLYYYWLVYVQKDVQWQNSFPSNLKQPKGIFFCHKENIFCVYKNFYPPHIYPFCHHEKKKSLRQFPSKA